MSKKLKILVTGAAGQQGGATARELIARGHTVRAMTRKTTGDSAKALARLGAEVVAGDFNDPATLTGLAKDVDTVFLMGTPFEAGIDAETEQGLKAVDALKASGVGHVVYASVASADKKTGIPHFESKFLVEQRLKASGLAYTISAPVFFMENVISPWSIGPLPDGVLAFGMKPKRPLQQVAVADIGTFVASLIERREQVFGRRYDIAGDELSFEAAAAAIASASGRRVKFQEIPVAAIKAQNEDVGLMLEWFDKTGYSADIEGLRREFPEVKWQTFADWTKTIDWQTVLARPAVAAE